MSGYRVTHDLDEDPTIYDGQVLDEPLEFEDGEAVVADEETARNLQRRHTHVDALGPVQDSDDVAEEEMQVDVSELTIDELDETLEEADLDDDELERLREEEADSKNRDGALDVIDDRLEG